jgi:hypothetical protein
MFRTPFVWASPAPARLGKEGVKPGSCGALDLHRSNMALLAGPTSTVSPLKSGGNLRKKRSAIRRPNRSDEFAKGAGMTPDVQRQAWSPST